MIKINKFIFTLLATVSFLFAHAERDHVLHLKSGDVEMQQLEATTQLDNYTSNWNTDYVIIQFYTVPGVKAKNKIAANGIELLEYLPNYSFLAQLSSPTNIQVNELNIRSIIPFVEDYKYAPRLANQEKPEWAMSGKMASLILEPQDNVNKAQVINKLRFLGIEVESIDPSDIFYQISIHHDDIEDFAKEDFVKYLDYIPAPPEKEDLEGITVHRANMLNSSHPLGRKYDGTGISITVADDGAIGPHIDIKGRVTQFINVDGGSHGDMTTGIAMGAGNLNPRMMGMAPGAFLYYYNITGYPHITNAVFNLNNRDVVISSTSYSEGCNAGYTSLTRTLDQQVRQNPEILHVFSAGNSAGSTCGTNAYGAGIPWGTITGGRKQGKSTIATGNLTYVDGLVGSSSRGPAYDGRIKPDLCANGGSQMSTNAFNTYQVGGGTSAAAPGLAGVAALLYHGYKDLHGDTVPESGLIKAALLNTARDIGNVGPDFTYGWGRINGHRAMTLLEENRYFDDTVSQSNQRSHTININDSDLVELKFMIYWTDYEASTAAATALVNDLDLRVVTPNNDTIQPWVLDHTANATALNSVATRGNDDLNNVEQVSIDTVNAGNYELLITGLNVPQGPQKYFVVWETKKDIIEVTYPNGGETFVPGETETIRWDAVQGSGAFGVSYSVDSGATWTNISLASGSSRHRDWIVPTNVTGNALIRVERRVGRNVVASGISQNTFTIQRLPGGISTEFVCFDSIKVSWNKVPGATGYEVSKLGAMYMDSIGRTSDTFFVFQNTTYNDENWVSVKAIKNEIIGRRANAVLIPQRILRCPFAYDASIADLISPSASYVLNCNVTKIPVQIRVENKGDSSIVDLPVQFTFNNVVRRDTVFGTIAPGGSRTFEFRDSLGLTQTFTNRLKVKALLASDADFTNDSLEQQFDVLNGVVKSIPYRENFDNMTTCVTTSNCGTTVCALGNDWSNLSSTRHDDFDMRVNSGSTPSQGTGPTADHTLGNSTGQYIYSEASNGCYDVTSEVLSPCIDLSNTIDPELKFWYHMQGQFMGSLQVSIYSDGSLDSILTISGDQGSAWLQQKVDLKPYIGKTINVRFLFRTGIFWSSDMAIDDVSILDKSTGIDDIYDQRTFSIYPNPSNGIFTLEFDQIPTNPVAIFDLKGRKLNEYRISSNQTSIDLSGLDKGVYILNVLGTKSKEKLIIY